MESNLEPHESNSDMPRSAPTISSAAMDALRHSLQGDYRADGKLARARVRRAVQIVCADARLKRYTPERLLIDVKDALRVLPEVQQMQRGPERDEFISSVVTLCIDEFFGQGSAPSRRR
jgi:hypothetical protein